MPEIDEMSRTLDPKWFEGSGAGGEAFLEADRQRSGTSS
jgi:hypothetical protein